MRQTHFSLQVATTTFAVIVAATLIQAGASAAILASLADGAGFFQVFLPALSALAVYALSVAAALAIYLYLRLRPLQKTVNRLQDGHSVSVDVKRRARTTILGLSRAIYLGNIAGFSLGAVVNLVVDPASAISIAGVSRLLGAVAAGVVFAAIQVGITDGILTEPCRRLGIHSFDPSAGDTAASMYRRRALVSVALSVYIITLLSITLFGYFEHAGAATISRDGIALASAIALGYAIVISAIVLYTSSLGERSQIRSITARLGQLANRDGVIDRPIAISQFDEVGIIASRINRILQRQRKIMQNVRSAATEVISSSENLNEVIEETKVATERMSLSIEQLNSTAEINMASVNSTGETLKSMLASVDRITEQVDTQAGFVEQSSSAVTELAESIRSVAETTDRANSLATRSDTVAREGGVAVKASLQSIHDIEEASSKVDSIITVIQKISAQTNMLAMNASIEAAHAGDSGRGFAVVAEEVRSLAVNSAASAREISEHIKQMRSQVQSGVSTAEDAGTALERIQTDIAETSEMISHIASAMREQNAGTEELLSGISSLVESTESIRTVAGEQRDRNEKMRSALDELVGSFSEINSSSEQQAEGTRGIVASFGRLQEVSETNSRVVEHLREISGGADDETEVDGETE